MKAGEEKLTVACRILLHLSSLSRFQERFIRPRGMTQQGMAEELGINRALASKELKRLTEGGRVKSELKHVFGTKRQKKTYFLTNLGERLAAELKQIAAGEATEGREDGVGGRPDGVRVLARKQATDR